MIFLYPTLSHFSTCFYYRHTVYLNLIFFTNTSITYIFILSLLTFFFFFFFNDTATTEIYTLSLHDALPICVHHIRRVRAQHRRDALDHFGAAADERQQRARVRGFAAAAHRRVDDVHACTLAFLRQCLHCSRIDGAEDSDDRSRRGAAQRTAPAEQLLHFAVEAHADEDRVARRRQLHRTPGPGRAHLLHRLGPGAVDVADLRREAFAHEVPDDGRAHAPRADDADAFHLAETGAARHFSTPSVFA